MSLTVTQMIMPYVVILIGGDSDTLDIPEPDTAPYQDKT